MDVCDDSRWNKACLASVEHLCRKSLVTTTGAFGSCNLTTSEIWTPAKTHHRPDHANSAPLKKCANVKVQMLAARNFARAVGRNRHVKDFGEELVKSALEVAYASAYKSSTNAMKGEKKVFEVVLNQRSFGWQTLGRNLVGASMSKPDSQMTPETPQEQKVAQMQRVYDQEGPAESKWQRMEHLFLAQESLIRKITREAGPQVDTKLAIVSRLMRGIYDEVCVTDKDKEAWQTAKFKATVKATQRANIAARESEANASEAEASDGDDSDGDSDESDTMVYPSALALVDARSVDSQDDDNLEDRIWGTKSDESSMSTNTSVGGSARPATVTVGLASLTMIMALCGAY